MYKTLVEHESKAKLLAAAINVVRSKGYNAARVDDICAAAGVTKGSFFHHFDSKDDLAQAAAELWLLRAKTLCKVADVGDPRGELLAYIDLRKSMMAGELTDWTCFSGTMIQEIYATHPALRDACQKAMTQQREMLTGMIENAVRHCGLKPDWTAESLARHIQATLQGAFILAKGEDGPEAAHEAMDHLRRYVEQLFPQKAKT